MERCAIVYNESNRYKMECVKESLNFHCLEIDFLRKEHIQDCHKVLVVDDINLFPNKNRVLIISSADQRITDIENIILIQYESENIKEKVGYDKAFESVVINCIPKQKLEIKPFKDQSSTIFYHGKDCPENMVNELFDLDTRTRYEIMYYRENTSKEPSLLHKLSWCVSVSENTKGIITAKIINEIKNGCLPVLLEEYAPKYLKNYPFMIKLDEIHDKEIFVERFKEIIHDISKMTRDEFSTISNSLYNSIYINSEWKWNYYLISEKIINTLNLK